MNGDGQESKVGTTLRRYTSIPPQKLTDGIEPLDSAVKFQKKGLARFHKVSWRSFTFEGFLDLGHDVLPPRRPCSSNPSKLGMLKLRMCETSSEVLIAPGMRRLGGDLIPNPCNLI
jgi:hypothetical protein